MELMKFILWLTVGAVIGWLASRIVAAEKNTSHKTNEKEDCCSD